MNLREAWNRLAESRRKASVFLFHEWFAAAWEWRKLDSSLFLMCAYAEERLVGVLPLVIDMAREGRWRTRRVDFLTVPDTQLCDLLVAPEYVEPVSREFAAELLRQRSRWDELRLDYLASDAVAARELRSALEAAGFRSQLQGRGRNLAITLDTSWDAYYQTRSRSLKKANNLAANRLKKKGEVTIEWLRSGSDPAALAAAVAAAFEISKRSWKGETGTTLDQPGPGAFIRALSRLAESKGWLSIWILRLEGCPLATEYQLIYNGDVHALRADFDVSCLDISPGSHLSHRLLERLFAQGLKGYYMGPGENPYKLRWSSDGDGVAQLRVYGRTLRGRYIWLRDAVVRRILKKLLQRATRIKQPADSKLDEPDQGSA